MRCTKVYINMRHPKFLKVPNNNIDYDALFAQVDALKFKRKDKIANVKNSIIILLNMIQYPEYRRIKELKNHYYSMLSYEEMVKVFSVEGWYLVKGLLEKNYIIESDRKYEDGVVPMGYKLVINKLGPDSKYLKLEEFGSVYKNYFQTLIIRLTIFIKTLTPSNNRIVKVKIKFKLIFDVSSCYSV